MRRARMLVAVKWIVVTALIAGVLVLSQSSARADELTIVGTTTGAFPAGSTLNNLTYNPALINGATTNGILLLNAEPKTPNINNLGSFTLVGIPSDFNEGLFGLTVQFASPSGIIVGNPQQISGSAFLFNSDNQFGLLIDMNNTPQLFTFSNETGTGVFSLTVDDVFFNLGAGLAKNNEERLGVVPTFVLPLTGTIRVISFTPIPEPATLVLLATGMAGVAASLRRRKGRKDER